MLANIYAAVRQAARRAWTSGGDQKADINVGGDLIVSQGQPEQVEIVRMGKSWLATIATANAFTYVNAWPTTRAELLMYNNSPTLSLVVEEAWMVNITSMAAAQPISLLGQNCAPGLAAAPTDGTTTIVQTSLSNKNAALTRTGSALFALANTAFCLANHWDLLDSTNSPMTTNLGQGIVARKLKYIIPPTGAFGLAGLAGTAAGTAIIGVKYHEELLDLG